MRRMKAPSAFAVIILSSFLLNSITIDCAFSDEDLANDVKVITLNEVTVKEAPKEFPKEPVKVITVKEAPKEVPKEPVKVITVKEAPKEPVKVITVKEAPKEVPKEVKKEAAKEELKISPPIENNMDIPSVEIPEKVYQLKRIDPNRIGAESSYLTYGGFRPIDYVMKNPALGVGTRVEIYQEPKPVDAYMMMAKEMQYVWSDYHGMRQNLVEQTPANFRSIVVPIFVRAYGTEFTLSDPNESSSDIRGQIKYTVDYRDVYKDQYPKFPALKAARWLQQEVLFISTAKINPLDWWYTSNLGFRYSTVNIKDNLVVNPATGLIPTWSASSGDEGRATYYVNQSMVFNPRLELFGQGEYFKSNHYRSNWSYDPDHYLIAGELRMKSADLKTSYTGRFSYSIDIYKPTNNMFEKYEIWARLGHDFNDRLNAYTMLKYAYGHTRSEDNAWWQVIPGGAPWQTQAYPGPLDVTALALTSENRVQYRIYDKLWIQGGFDLGTGINMSDFDNIGWLAGLEYYAPGIIRVDVGWRGNQFYNIDDFLSTIYFKCYLFM